MKIVHILKKEPGAFDKRIIEAQKNMKDTEIKVFELFKEENFDPDELLKAVEEAEKVFCW